MVRSSKQPARTKQRPLAARFFWLSMGLTGACVGIVLWLVMGNVSLGDFSLGPRLFILALLAIFLIASLASTEVIPWNARSWAEWRRPKVLGTIVYLFLGAVGFVTGIAGIFGDKLMTEEQGTELKALVKANQTNIARQKIPGLWGEGGPDCTGNTFRFTVNGDAMQLTGVRQPPQAKEPFALDGNIQPPDPNAPSVLKFEITGKIVNGQRETGRATFTYLRNGSGEELNWDDLVNPDPRKLFKCKVQT